MAQPVPWAGVPTPPDLLRHMGFAYKEFGRFCVFSRTHIIKIIIIIIRGSLLGRINGAK
tara:strand:- start:464 stop:640 length:177 start_codon:yes stop_codon:yes gene_type:complete